MPLSDSNWYVYMLMCSDGTVYTGITNDLTKRIAKHNSAKGAKYTRSRIPVILKALWSYPGKSEASKAEYEFKQLPRDQKLRIIQNFPLASLGEFIDKVNSI